jgi:pimeloyl-ACP methyl ester carboxylesterase
VAEAGPPDGPLLILLHGFPEFWYGWRNQIGRLAEHGFHVVAPDQRGYNLSDKPKGIPSYDLDQLAADVAGLADHYRQDSFTVASHDWGASVGWWLAGQPGNRVRRFVALNAPHPAVWIDAMHNHPIQKRKSGYVRFFRLPWLPEFLVGLNRSKALAGGFRDSVRPGAFSDADLDRYRAAWGQPGALTAMINYYRAILRKPLLPPGNYRIQCPVLVIWGRRDAYALPDLAEASVRLCDDGRIVYLDRATHWVEHDEPARVTELILEHVRSN